MIKKYNNHILQTYPQYSEEVPQNTNSHKTSACLGMSVTTQNGSGRQYVGSGRQYITDSWRNE